jgi:hypothetical protein
MQASRWAAVSSCATAGGEKQGAGRKQQGGRSDGDA